MDGRRSTQHKKLLRQLDRTGAIRVREPGHGMPSVHMMTVLPELILPGAVRSREKGDLSMLTPMLECFNCVAL